MKSLQSITQWETSYFGGINQLLEDYPQISIPDQIKSNPGSKEGEHILEGVKQKVLDIFINCVAEDRLRKGYKCYGYSQTLIEKSDPVLIDGKTFAKVDPIGIRIVLNQMLKRETELAPLFDYYQKVILDSEILFEMKSIPFGTPKSGNKKGKEQQQGSGLGAGNQNKKGKEKKQGAGAGEGSGNPLSEEEIINEMEKSIQEALSQVEKIENTEKGPNLESFPSAGYGQYNELKICQPKGMIIYNGSERYNAQRLSYLLDINLNPKIDKVTNLRLGKLDASKISEMVCGNTNIYYTMQEEISTQPFTICVLRDESGSMHGGPASKAYSIMKTLYLTFRNILGDDKIYMFGHDDGILRVYQDRYFPNFERSCLSARAYGGTEDYKAVHGVYKRIRSQTQERTLFIMITDSQPGGGSGERTRVKQMLKKCKSDGFVTVGIGIGAEWMKNMFEYWINLETDDSVDKSIHQMAQLINNVVKMEFE